MDIEGKPLPTLVYLAREKRPQYHHHFKAGAMNALVSNILANCFFFLYILLEGNLNCLLLNDFLVKKKKIDQSIVEDNQ